MHLCHVMQIYDIVDFHLLSSSPCNWASLNLMSFMDDETGIIWGSLPFYVLLIWFRNYLLSTLTDGVFHGNWQLQHFWFRLIYKAWNRFYLLFSPFQKFLKTCKIPYFFKLNSRNTRTTSEICSELIIKRSEQRQLMAFRYFNF